MFISITYIYIYIWNQLVFRNRISISSSVSSSCLPWRRLVVSVMSHVCGVPRRCAPRTFYKIQRPQARRFHRIPRMCGKAPGKPREFTVQMVTVTVYIEVVQVPYAPTVFPTVFPVAHGIRGRLEDTTKVFYSGSDHIRWHTPIVHQYITVCVNTYEISLLEK